MHHVVVAGGAPAEWSALSAEQWSTRMCEMGKVADHAGARFLTLRPFGGDFGGSTVDAMESVVGSCRVIVDPQSDGRQRLASVASALHARGEAITEATLAAALNSPADTDPDLVVILAERHRMPPSLVWELAYSELVFADVGWGHFSARNLEDAIGSYARRHRRFGGID